MNRRRMLGVLAVLPFVRKCFGYVSAGNIPQEEAGGWLSLADFKKLQGFVDNFFGRLKAGGLIEPDVKVSLTKHIIAPYPGTNLSYKLILKIESDSWGPSHTTHRFDPSGFGPEKQMLAIERMCKRTFQVLPEIREKLSKQGIAT